MWYIDPTGYGWWSKFWGWFKKAWKGILAITLVVATAVVGIVQPQLQPFLWPILLSQMSLGITGATSAAIRGGDVGAGALFGVTAGTVVGSTLGAMGSIGLGGFWGAISGAGVFGVGAGTTSAYAGGKGNFQDILKGGLYGGLEGAAFGAMGWGVGRLSGVLSGSRPKLFSLLRTAGADPALIRVSKIALSVKPICTLVGAASGAAIGGLMSKGDWGAIAAGALSGAMLGYASSGVRFSFSEAGLTGEAGGLPINYVDAKAWVKGSAQTKVFGIPVYTLPFKEGVSYDLRNGLRPYYPDSSSQVNFVSPLF